jgi:hypothetical protein
MHHHYDMITENIAIGDQFTLYEPFDIIINMNYSYNGVKHNHIIKSYSNNKLIYKVGINDSIGEEICKVFVLLIPILIQ